MHACSKHSASRRSRLMYEIALFPLNTVLFPGGLLPLRIFETRYVDMVGRCMRANEAFGVVLASRRQRDRSEVETASVGTRARVVDFQTLEDGLLGLLCRGEQRFRIQDRSRRMTASIAPWSTGCQAARVSRGGEFQPLVPLLRQAMAQLSTIGRFIEPDYDDASWVGSSTGRAVAARPESAAAAARDRRPE